MVDEKQFSAVAEPVIFPLGSRVIVVDPPAESKATILLPQGADVDKLGRGIIIRLPESPEPMESDNGSTFLAFPDPATLVLRPGDVVYFGRYFRLGDVKVVDTSDIIAYEKTAARGVPSPS